LSILKREFRKLYQAHHNATFALLSMLQMHEGGTVTIAEATMKAILPKLQTLSWKSERNEENNSITLTLVDSTPTVPEQETVPNVTIRYVPEEDPNTGEAPEPTDSELLTDALEGDGA
jgi:hypothetical protein